MVRRPKEWEKWTQEERMKWLREQRTECNGGRKVLLTEKDTSRVWSLLKKYDNNSLVADLLEIDRTTLYRFLKKYPMPADFVLNEDAQLEDYAEMKIWLTRIEGFAKKNTINNYMVALRQFYEHMKKNYPERARPRLWTSDDITQYVYAQPKHLWHWTITPLRSLALKAQEEFPNINLGLLPTKKTHKAKRSLAGKEEYYYEPEQVDAMILNASTKRGKALIATLYNLAPRTKAVTEIRIENQNLENHRMLIKDKGSIWWDTYGMTNKTVRLITEYLEERGYPKSGWLFCNGGGTKMTRRQVNQVIKEAGTKAGITDKVLTAKAFRKSFVENYFEIPDADPMILAGSGKGTQDQPKTAFCVGWSLKVLMEHYAPKMKSQIGTYRQKFGF